MHREMIAATLFSGIGAPECAMPHWRWVWCAEIEPFPSAVLAVRHPQSINLGDVTADDFAERASAIGRPDVLVFGSPCQDWSIAGKRLGLAGARGNMALVALGIIGRLRPSWFVFENVPGLLSSADGRDFGLFLRTVDDLGYSGAWASLDAQWFGVAQRRKRLFFVGHIADWRYPTAVLVEPESLCGASPPRREAGQAVAAGLGAGSPRSGGRVGRREAAGNQVIAFDTPAIAFGGNRTSGPIEVATALNAHGGPTGRCDFASETFVVNARHDPIVAHDCAHSLGGQHNGMDNAVLSEVPSALRASQGGGDKAYVLPSAVRRLTPRETERLQGFQDNFTAITYRGKAAADGPRYRALGNSMAVPVMRWILSRIEFVDALSKADLGRPAPSFSLQPAE